MTNLFQEAKRLLTTKKREDLTPEEEAVVSAALIPILHLPHGTEKSVLERLDSLGSLAEKLELGKVLPDAPPPRPRTKHSPGALAGALR